jgi:hypothetical protein
MSKKPATVTLKRGDSFIFSNNQLLGEDEMPLDLTGWEIRSQIRNKQQRLVKELDVTINQYDYSISSMETSKFPVDTLYWDIQYTTPDGVIFSSDTVNVVVVQDITY